MWTLLPGVIDGWWNVRDAAAADRTPTSGERRRVSRCASVVSVPLIGGSRKHRWPSSAAAIVGHLTRWSLSSFAYIQISSAMSAFLSHNYTVIFIFVLFMICMISFCTHEWLASLFNWNVIKSWVSHAAGHLLPASPSAVMNMQMNQYGPCSINFNCNISFFDDFKTMINWYDLINFGWW